MPETSDQPARGKLVPSETLVRVTHAIYALQALGFFTALTWIAAVVMNYVKLDDVRGTWLESHFRWQIRTFWWGLLWSVLGLLTALIVIGHFILLVVGVWVIYRIVKGWLRLNDGKEMYL